MIVAEAPPASFSAQDALVAAMVGVSASDENMTTKELLSISRMVDTLPMARTRHPGAKHTLDALCSRFGIDRSHRVLHGALLDAQLLAQVYVELTGGRQIGLGLLADKPAASAATVAAIACQRCRGPNAASGACRSQAASRSASSAWIGSPATLRWMSALTSRSATSDGRPMASGR